MTTKLHIATTAQPNAPAMERRRVTCPNCHRHSWIKMGYVPGDGYCPHCEAEWAFGMEFDKQ